MLQVYGPEATMTGICKQAIECVMAAAQSLPFIIFSSKKMRNGLCLFLENIFFSFYFYIESDNVIMFQNQAWDFLCQFECLGILLYVTEQVLASLEFTPWLAKLISQFYVLISLRKCTRISCSKDEYNLTIQIAQALRKTKAKSPYLYLFL